MRLKPKFGVVLMLAYALVGTPIAAYPAATSNTLETAETIPWVDPLESVDETEATAAADGAVEHEVIEPLDTADLIEALAVLSFVDVPPGTSFYREIMWLAQSGVSSGWADGTFRPYRPVTRDAMAAFMYRLAGVDGYVPPAVSPFVDVPTDYQFYTEIAWLAQSGISTGWATPRGKEYRPWNLITRDAMAAFLYRFAGSPAYYPSGASPFRDVSTSSSFSNEIRWLAAEGISTGWDVGYGCRDYRPFAHVARDAMAAFMYRAINGGTARVTSNTCAPPPPPQTPPTGSSVVAGTVTPGAFCAQHYAGWYGYTSTGKLMQCKTSASDSRLRWREV